ncbi:uncharacterized protein LOC117590704 [Drosophila guanche]|uniref:Blast:Microtubule-associated protein RP/EB family member 1 n=1 Tax=Drosophila guanche TaxID=7266 RepID=A0A3B0K4G5_DROGU|nr:uncharacterized protein LOC117590704 [Drosophila guanche]SPP89094.1 blast:Microtubule-associated protein RP/EB family member 1 [Drosophila guanche]
MPGTHGHPKNPKQLLKWINVMLHSDYRSMPELSGGAAWCRLLHCIHPNTFNVESVRDAGPPAKLRRNYDILRRALKRLGIPLELRVQQLQKGNTQVTIELIHFFMDLYVQRKLQRPQPQPEHGPLGKFLQWLQSLVVGKSAADDPQAYLLLFEKMPKLKPLKASQPTQTVSCEMLPRLSGGQEQKLQLELDQRRRDHDEIHPLIGACHQMLLIKNEMKERWQECRRARLAQKQQQQQQERRKERGH